MNGFAKLCEYKFLGLYTWIKESLHIFFRIQEGENLDGTLFFSYNTQILVMFEFNWAMFHLFSWMSLNLIQRALILTNKS